ncbi:MAG: hypothetical protein JJ896_07565 [Rhodothermales bacterium]|nr:hypothetical protein [Rhodothermales bacterium]MBO6779496.1 hypothetical protein [Rhodothermales bacterium]
MKHALTVLVLATVLVPAASVTAQSTEARSPQSALLRGLAFPGLGQVYNRDYVKLPVLYAGIAVFAYNVANNHSEYVLYKRAFQYKAWQELIGEDDINPAAAFEAQYDEITARFGRELSSAPLENQRDNLRRNRDLSILGIGAMWALGVLDAYVSAHLSSFDVGENLTLRVQPVHELHASGQFRTGFQATLRW